MNEAAKKVSSVDGPMPGKTRVCVVGLGHWGPNIVRAIEAHSDAVVVCAADQSEQRRAQVRERIPLLSIEQSFQDCLGNYEFDAVVIAVPTEFHFQLGMQALEAGKHVMIEKPLALTSQEAIELCNEADARKRTLMTGHIFLYNEGITACREMVNRGDLGKILYMHSIRTNLGPLRSDVSALWDLAPHDIAIFNYIFDAMPIRVTCSAYHLLGRPVEDMAQGSLFYPGNRVATFFVSWLDPQKKREVTIVGDRRMLTFDDMKPDRPLKMYDKGVTVQQETEFTDSFHSFRLSIRDGLCTEPEVSTGAPLRNECVHFIDCVRSGKRPLTDGLDGLNVVRVLEALSRSAMERGAPVSVRLSEGGTDRGQTQVFSAKQSSEASQS
jgi:predicted dehydrogenase